MSPGSAPLTATGPGADVHAQAFARAAPEQRRIHRSGAAPVRRLCASCPSRKCSRRPGSPFTMRSASSLAWCVTVSMVTKSPDCTSTSGLRFLLK